ncbi:ribokinase [bacterium]|nr:ribokinase [bacterium]
MSETSLLVEKLMNSESKPAAPGKILVVGAVVLDRIFYVKNLPKPGETAIGSHQEIHPGGKGANQALAAKKTGADVRFISAVGNDENADIVLHPLRDAGIDCSSIYSIPDQPTAEAIIAVDAKGENQITACPGAYGKLKGENLHEQVEAFRWADWLLIQNELPRSTVEIAMKLARENGCKIIFNPAPFKVKSTPIPENIDVLIPNEVEANAILGVDDYLAIAPHERHISWSQLFAENIIVTLGKSGVEWFEGKKRTSYEGTKVKVRDSVGAGDAFCGILAAFLGEGFSMTEAISLANTGAGMSVEKNGAQDGLPERKELEQRYLENSKQSH